MYPHQTQFVAVDYIKQNEHRIWLQALGSVQAQFTKSSVEWEFSS